MTRLLSSALAALLALGVSAAAPLPTMAADMPAATTYQATYPSACTEGWVLRAISQRFRHQVRHVPNLPDVGISDFQGIYTNRYLPAGEDRPIGRTYCGATALMSDGRGRNIWYLVEEGQGFASIGDNVEFCVAGFDRWFVYNGLCRVLH
ncbi:hypothetical protein [Mesorhizobium xinjiangense]|uniref:hypothetical protein n=1 Tax=Mesorhizobium xinjiangense TaxID=2678685 RepID=UPI0012EDFD9C|nr:hypothetical protein [Mesorhizobium xinjiangense]